MAISFKYVAVTLCGRPSHAVLLEITNFSTVRNPGNIATSGLASSAFARHYSRNLGWCLFLALLRCFSSGGSPRMAIWFTIRYLAVGFPIRKSPAQCSFAAPRSLSQLITSFIGSWCQGIPLALFFAWPLVEANPAHSVSVRTFRFGRKLHIALLLLLSEHDPLRWAPVRCSSFTYLQALQKNPSLVSLLQELCRLNKKFLFSWNCFQLP